MKHAGDDALDELEPLLAQLRTLPRLREKKRGTFYVGAKAYLHFHEDPAGPFADLKPSLDGGYERFRVRTVAERARLVTLARRALT